MAKSSQNLSSSTQAIAQNKEQGLVGKEVSPNPPLDPATLSTTLARQQKDIQRIDTFLFVFAIGLFIAVSTLLFCLGTILYQSWWEKEKSYTDLMKRVDGLQTELLLQKQQEDSN